MKPLVLGLVVASLGHASAALAQQTHTRTEGDRTVTVMPEWYGDRLLVIYGICYAAGGTGYALSAQNSGGVQAVGALLFGSALVGSLFGPPIVHWSHDESAKGWISMGGQVGAALTGFAIGLGLEQTGDSAWNQHAPLLGAVVGHLTFALFDSFVLARHEHVLSWELKTARRRPHVEPPALRPLAVPGGLGLELFAAF